jgi:16S rRNA (adenine1518-N6/adenine1519-N6)-dimethyltransferase
LRAGQRERRLSMTAARAHQPRKRFGQHFLHDRRVIERIVAAVAPSSADRILEIGPGEGALTAALAGRAAHLYVIEIDRDLAARLEREYDPREVTVQTGDALHADLRALPGPLRIVGNLPYNVSTPLLFHLLTQAGCIVDMHFMLQREVVDRMVAEPSRAEYGRLSVMVQQRCRAVRLFTVSSGAFRPPPKVESAVVRLVPRPAAEMAGVDEGRFAALVTRAFSHRRKTLRNALAPEVDAATLLRLGIDPGLRPENLSYADYRRIAAGSLDPAPRSADLP